jgi:hypothetical protein
MIAGVLAVQSLVVLLGAAVCLVYAKEIILDPAIMCDPKDKLAALMQGMLAAALALLAGFTKGPPSPPKDK